MLYGRRQYNLRSRFLEEIPYDLLEEKDPSEPPGRQYKKPKPMELRSRVSAPGVHASAFGSPARKLGTPLVENAQEEFLVGDKIMHEKFGQGIIMGVSGKGRQAVLTINFQGQLKQIATEYVKLIKLKTKESG
jgi:DNA helicase-2/ATP-dependent DNA helicase PcrA